MEWTQENFGTTDVTFNITFFLLSSDPPDITPRVLGRNLGASQPAGTSSTSSRTVTVPSDITQGRYFLGVCLDDDNSLAESSEDNNCLTHPRSIFISSPLRALTVGRTGAGTGAVSSNPPGISCPSDCSESYPANKVVTLIATPGANSVFAGWNGNDVD